MTRTSEKCPTVSVVMSVFGNCEDLQVTVESVLSQDHEDFELILIDDGNAETARAEIARIAEADRRIRLLVNEKNIGLTRSLIKGCGAARGEFIARIDCGDLMSPRSRLSTQLRCLRDDPAVGLVSGGIEMWDLLNMKRWRSRLKTRSHEEICSRPRYVSWADHPTVMFRKSTYEAAGGYNPDWVVGQDTELWPRMAEHGHIVSLPEVFAVRTLKPDSISVARNSAQVRGKIKRMKRLGQMSAARRCVLTLREYLKLLVPMRQRLNTRHRLAMEYVGPVPPAIGQSLERISQAYFSDNLEVSRQT